ncbi:hypothetical protein CGC21_25700 [Leishmania donovani]|uniref:Uncharacterized protein n=1 Tax=Leishmania donovani TaxID=5661 RepID=A0A504WTQ8_LEIDO|nr:hypothetical protein CGC21_25700 [Leishmania donovani]
MPPPLRKPSLGPQGQRTLQRSSRPAPPSSRSRSPSTSSNNSDDDFVYVLGHVKSTEEAVECIRAVQQPKEKHQGRFLGGLGGSAKSLTELVTTSENRYPASRKMKGELPATMEEFYESPRYTVSLTAAREALFSDALSGFHSYVAREEEQCDQLCTYATQGGAVRTSAIPSPSPAMTQEWNTTLAASSALPAKPASMAVKVTGVVEEGHAQVATPASALPPNKRPERTGAPSTAADPSIPSPSAVPGPAHTSLRAKAAFPPGTVAAEAVTAAVAEGMGSGSPRVPASYMFLMRSRDSEAMSPGSSPAPAATPHSVTLESPEFPSSRDSRASGRTTTASGQAPGPTTNFHVDAAAPAAAVGKGAKQLPAPLTPAQETERAAKLEAMWPYALLQKAIHHHESVPVVFRYRYSPDFEETIDENKKRQQQLDRALRKHHWLAGSRGLTHAERQEISRRFADPNALAHEWLYVWEQFERDIPRETLLVEDTPYHDASDALAAILSYVEYGYDRSQQHVKKKLAAALADEKNGDAATTPAATAAASLGAGNSSSSPASRRETTLLEHFFSASTAALKGAVVKMRASLPDFVGDPLLSVSGYNPALYHASLLFPTDPKARSEKIFSAVREVVLASQQSFMGFPGASASIPIEKTAEAEPAVKEITTSMHSSLHGSRVLRIYHSFPSPTSVTNRSGSDHRHRRHTVHVVDEWNVSSSSSRSSDAVPSSLSLNISPATTAPPPPSEASEESTEEKEQPVRKVGKQSAAVLDVLPAHCLSEEARRRKETVARLRRERRRRRRKQLPLLVGEPRSHEFAAFLDIVRSRQTEEDPLAPTAQPADTAMAPRKLFHEDVEGSAYLIPTRSASATIEPPSRSPRSLLSSTSMREVSVSPEMRGMRIRLFFDDKRNVPVVVVNKLFRLFTMPGLRGFTSSDDDTTEALNEETAAKAATAHPSAPARKSGAGRAGSLEKSVLLLIQVQFSLFLQEDAEVRWKWWKL